MRLSRLYTNNPDLFQPIEFSRGLNVVLAEIRLPGNRAKDTHNLGKTTLGRLIDFCLLKGADPSFFLMKRKEVFEGFVFFLEVELLDGGYVTIRREVSEPTKIWLKRHDERLSDFRELEDAEWDHAKLAFTKAVKILDGILDLRDLKPWPYRQLIGYLIRSQSDYQDVFQLSKFKGKDAYWKPFLAQLLGFDADRIVAQYEGESELEAAVHDEEVVERELGGSVDDLSKIEGLLLLRQTESEERTRLLDEFDFKRADADKTRLLVDELDAAIGDYNAQRYTLSHDEKRIIGALKEDRILFDPGQAAELFEEAGVLFAGQLKKDFDQLLEFNKAITEERRGYLQEELEDTRRSLAEVNDQIAGLEGERAKALAFLSDLDALAKYKKATDELVSLRAEVVALERQRESLKRLQALRSRIRELQEQVAVLQEDVEADVEGKNADHDSLFSSIRLLFSQLVAEVIGREALLLVKLNQKGHLDFRAEILDEDGRSSDADAGTTYRKLLCIALDLAVLRARLDGRCPRFVFHDGVFESLDDRKKENLLAAMREYADLGVQQIITLIDSDLPTRDAGADPVFSKGEIVLTLHDEGDSGRLFKMRGW